MEAADVPTTIPNCFNKQLVVMIGLLTALPAVAVFLKRRLQENAQIF